MTTALAWGGWLLVAAAALPATSISQGAPQLRLPAANASLAEEFTSIGSVRELSDGRVLITAAPSMDPPADQGALTQRPPGERGCRIRYLGSDMG